MNGDPPARQYAFGSHIAQADRGGVAVVNVYEHVSPRPIDAAALDAGLEQLAAMPLDSIPGVMPLLAGSRVLLSPNPLFVDREAELRALARALKGEDGGAGVPIAAVTGLGGVGKTQLAVEFAHRYGPYFAGGVFWVGFGASDAVPLEVAACGGAGALDLRPDFAGLTPDEQVRHVLAAWQSPLPRLLIFDNCESEALLDRWRPPSGGCRILVTSRRGDWDPQLGVQALPLAVLGRPASVTLLRRHRPDLPAADLDLAAIAEELGDLPLAVHLAGSFLQQYRSVRTPRAYLAQLQAAMLRDRSLAGEGSIVATRHVRDVARTFAVSYEALDRARPADALARGLLARAICFAPGDPIPQPLLLATLDPGADGEVPLEAADALARLLDLGLVERAGDSWLRVHRLVAEFVRTAVADAGARPAVERALARTYERMRDAMAPGPTRTGALTELTARMRAFAARNGYGPADARRLFAAGSPGERILAVVVAGARPDPSCLDLLEDAIMGSRSAFEQYHALLAATAVTPLLDTEQRGRLDAALRDEVGHARYIGQDTSRHYLRAHLLTDLAQSGTAGTTRGEGALPLLPVGATVGKYHSLVPLDGGRPGRRYRGWDLALGREVAVWVWPLTASDVPSVVPRLDRELVALRTLGHPNLLAIWDHFVDGATLYLVTEPVTGEDLTTLATPLPVAEAVRLLAPIAAALDYAHAHGALHRAITPAHILFRRDSTPVLAGFGLQWLIAPPGGGAHAEVTGWDPEYLAPEQAFGPEGTLVGAWSDQYALAVVAYHLLTGRAPFSAATPQDVLRAHLQDPVPSPHGLNPSLGPGVEQVLLRGLAKNIGERYSSVTAFVDALAEAHQRNTALGGA
jgi:hypothetical protein